MKQVALLQLRIPPELHSWLGDWAKSNHRSMNNQITVVLEEIRKSQNETVTPPSPSKDLAA